MGDRLFRDKRLWLIMTACMCWGVLAHGMTLFNKYAYHDDALWVNGFNVIDTYGLGRWGRALLGKIALLIFGGLHSSTPAFFGILTIICIGGILYLLCVRLKIDDPVLTVALAGILVCYPAITGIFGFFFVSIYFYIGTFLGVAGIYIYYSRPGVWTFIICSLLLAFSTGLYQANIPVDLMVMLLFMLDEVNDANMKWKDYFILALKNAIMCAAFMAEYLVFNRIALAISGTELSDYKGVSAFGMTSPADYVLRIYSAYKRFFKPADFIGPQGVSANMYPWSLKYFHIVLILVSLVMIAIFIRTLGNRRKMVQTGLIFVISPLFAYFIYVMVGETDVHGLMTYGEAFMFFIPAYLMTQKERGPFTGIRTIAEKAALILMIVMGLVFARYDNVCYLKAEVMQTEAISYYNRLISRIQATEGYTADTPVQYVNGRSKNDEDFSGEKLFEPIYLPPYHRNSIINDYSWEETMDLWCAFAPVKADDENMIPEEDERITSMPLYPEEGSIRMIDGILVVRFAN